MDMESICVHNGDFHADDVFATAILKLIYPDLKVLRSRDPEIWKKVDALVDVGGKYSHEEMNYDHHQNDFDIKRENGIKYASCGLIWKHYGIELVSSEEVWRDIEEKIIQYIDADDNGQKFYRAEHEPYTLRTIIKTLNPQWPDRVAELYDENFFEVLEFAIKILEKEIELAERLVKAKKIVREKMKNCGEDYLVLDEYVPYKDVVREESEIKIVIYPDSNRETAYVASAVTKEKDGFDVRVRFPKDWAGLYNSELAKVSSIEDAIFCHKDLFIAVARTKESTIKMAKIALGKNGK
jgi:uncharacterized UPF0160 family protein